MSQPQQQRPNRSVTISLPSWSGLTSWVRVPRPAFQRFGQGRWLVAILVLVLLVGVGDALLLRQSGRQDDRESSRAAALESARARVPAMLSYSYRTLDADLAVASGNATGSFRQDYAGVLGKVVAPNAIKKKITTTAKVVGSGVVSGGGKEVTVLLLVTQSTVRGSSQKPTITGSRINVQMTRTTQGWFVSGIKPV